MRMSTVTVWIFIRNFPTKSCVKIIVLWVSCVCDPWNQIGGPSARARRRAANKGRSITCPILASQQRVAMISKLEDLWKEKKVSTPRRSSRSGRFESMLKMRQGKLTLASSGFMQCSNACFIHIHLLVYWFTVIRRNGGTRSTRIMLSSRQPFLSFSHRSAQNQNPMTCLRLASKNPAKLTTRSVLSKFCKNRLTVVRSLISCLKFQQHISISILHILRYTEASMVCY